MRANRGNQFRRRNLITHFTMNSGFALVDFDQQDGLAVSGGFEPQRAHFLAARLIVFGQERHGSGGSASRHRHSSSHLRHRCCCPPHRRAARRRTCAPIRRCVAVRQTRSAAA
ncbi:hypothetical protein BG57_20125 [Caballeronia grimmiae]|uniref:Uncharacterized protein n=1 Tax=Caballeronia grimmiae TaxID=1071679 RepID=A0A069NKE5_9BURK|nr:hypothetical protein BG57_20125 [Caballeronia grimmiae]